MPHHLRQTCQICGGSNLELTLSLGETALANSFLDNLDQAATEQTYPLALYFCHDCTLVQLRDIIDPTVLFAHYLYVTGTSETMSRHFRDYASDVVEYAALPEGSLVAEAASNDGSLLRHFQDLKMRVVGVEPAQNIAAMAIESGIPTEAEFFNEDSAVELRRKHGPAACVCGNNVLAHVDNTTHFLSGFLEWTRPAGLVVTEVPYLANLLEGLEYDTIYHEHLCYFSVSALSELFRRCGLSIVQVRRTPVHGGSLRVYARPKETVPDHAPQVRELIEEETANGLCDAATYHEFARKVAENRTRLRALLEALRLEGKTIAAYGAPAKGNTLLSYCGIGPDLVEFIVDKNPLKTHKFTPGTHIPVLPPEELQKRAPDYTLILAWNFADEIMRQQAGYTDQGGRFIVPLPEPRIL